MRGSVAVVLVAACGRIGFAPQGAPIDDAHAADASGDASASSGDASPADDGGTLDATSRCDTAITIQVGNTGPVNTCRGIDRVDACSAGKQEVVFRFVAQTARFYNVRALDPGTQNVSNSVARLDNTCTATASSCAGILGFELALDEVAFLVVEAASAACADIDLQLQ